MERIIEKMIMEDLKETERCLRQRNIEEAFSGLYNAQLRLSQRPIVERDLIRGWPGKAPWLG